jgi:excisionase family DNA binding protein
MAEINATLNLKVNVPGADPFEIILGKFIINPSQLVNVFPINQPIAEPKQNLLTTEELAKFLKKSPSGIRFWKRNGLIPFQRIGRSVFFNLEDVLAAIKNGPSKKIKVIKSSVE